VTSSSPLTLDDLVANDTVSAAGADVLRSIGARGESFLVHSLPRNAGKSTVMEAVLGASTAARRDFLGTPEETAALTAAPAEGYVVVAEMGHRGRPGYLAGDEITRAFDLARHGFALASSLHADTVDQVVEVLGANGVTPAELSAAVRYLIKVQPLGDPFDPATVRIIEFVHRVDGASADGGLVTEVLWQR
jgi:hypothetical protein